ncbi:MAG: hypothetical protein LBQ69_03725 [Treponema sp.]|jgi:hypothetical protein|nr:hypothetical protein [Treponema sp.]
MPVTTIVLGLVIGVAWLVACIMVIRKIGEKGKRPPLYVTAAVLFIVFAVVFAGSRIGAAVAAGALDKSAALAQEYLEKNHGSQPLVRNGVAVENVPQAIDDLEGMIPRKVSDLGLSGIITESLYGKALGWGFDILRSKAGLIASFANENGRVTSVTIMEALQWEINNLVRRVVFYITLGISVILALYLGICVILAAKKRRADV